MGGGEEGQAELPALFLFAHRESGEKSKKKKKNDFVLLFMLNGPNVPFFLLFFFSLFIAICYASAAYGVCLSTCRPRGVSTAYRIFHTQRQR